MEHIGGEGGFSFLKIDMEIQSIDLIDFEQSKNIKSGVIHKMWTSRSLRKIEAGPRITTTA